MSDPGAEHHSLHTAGRVLVFIVAYEAERHVASVFDRIPRELFNDDSIQFLMIDDASSDAGVRVARKWVESHGVHNVTLLRNPVNQGYGGNQKLGYRIGIEGGFDFIILLHGDGQYAPELLPQFIETWRKTNADVVLGSRMTSIKSARAGGMPWYKVVGNRSLTRLQNRLTGQKLSEYHTGYRGYSTRFLKQVPFEVNTNDFHFDTEILLQAFFVGAKIEEFGIPTHYGDEICRVNNVKYGLNVLLSSARYRLQRFGILCDLKYRRLLPAGRRDAIMPMYAAQEMALRIIERAKPATLLEIGCGSGSIAPQCEARGVRVTRVSAWRDRDARTPVASDVAKRGRDESVVDLEDLATLPVDPFSFDAVLMLDVIEHLADPESFLVGLRNRSRSLTALRKPPMVILSTPNIAFAAMRLNLLAGRFTYGERGILDIAHKRLFTRASLLRMLRDCGYSIRDVRGVGAPFHAVLGGSLGELLGQVAAALANVWPSMFGFQTLVICHPLPGVQQVLSISERHLNAEQMLDRDSSPAAV